MESNWEQKHSIMESLLDIGADVTRGGELSLCFGAIEKPLTYYQLNLGSCKYRARLSIYFSSNID